MHTFSIIVDVDNGVTGMRCNQLRIITQENQVKELLLLQLLVINNGNWRSTPSFAAWSKLYCCIKLSNKILGIYWR